MIVLGIDCTTKSTNVGVAKDGIIIGEQNMELGRKQAAELPLMVERLLADCTLKLSDIELIAAAKGPGYYTGIRTGVAYCAALAEALGLKIVPVSTMEAFVYDLRKEHTLMAPILKARYDSIYTAIYRSDGKQLTALRAPSFVAASHFAEMMEQHPKCTIVGSDRNLYPQIMFLANKHIERQSSSGGQTALLGETQSQSAILPYEIKGEYLREPDIGPSKQ